MSNKRFEVWMLDSNFKKFCKIANFDGEKAAGKANHCCIQCSCHDPQYIYNYFAV